MSFCMIFKWPENRECSTVGILNVCIFVVKCFRERWKKKMTKKVKRRTGTAHWFSPGLTVIKCIFFFFFVSTTFKTDILLLFSKDSLHRPSSRVCVLEIRHVMYQLDTLATDKWWFYFFSTPHQYMITAGERWAAIVSHTSIATINPQ